MIGNIYFPEQVYKEVEIPFMDFINQYSDKKTVPEKIEEIYYKILTAGEEFNNMFFIRERVIFDGKETNTEYIEPIGKVLGQYIKKKDELELPKNITKKSIEYTENMIETIDRLIGNFNNSDSTNHQIIITELEKQYSDKIENHFVYEPKIERYNNRPYKEIIEEYIINRLNENNKKKIYIILNAIAEKEQSKRKKLE